MTYRRVVIMAALALTATGSLAAPGVVTDSEVFIERRDPEAGRQLEVAETFDKGERVVTILRWQRRQGTGGFTITNHLPRAIAYQASSRQSDEVSVDGGQTWGRLGTLKIGKRLASPEDVTHVR